MLKLDNEYTIDEAQMQFPELVGRASRGEEIRIVNEDGCLVRLEGVAEPRTFTLEERQQAIREMREIAKRTLPLGCSIRELRDEGRR